MPRRCINPCVKDAEQASLGWHAARRAPVRRSPAQLPPLSPWPPRAARGVARRGQPPRHGMCRIGCRPHGVHHGARRVAWSAEREMDTLPVHTFSASTPRPTEEAHGHNHHDHGTEIMVRAAWQKRY